MNALLWTTAGVLAGVLLSLAVAIAAPDVAVWLRRRWPTDRRHTLPPIRTDRWDSTDAEVMLLGDDLRAVRQPANWLDEGPTLVLPRALPAAPAPLVPVVPGRPRTGTPGYRPRHALADAPRHTVSALIGATQAFEAIAAGEGLPVRDHGPRERVTA